MFQILNQEDPAGKIDDKTVNGLTGVKNSLAYRVHEIERHFHSRELWYGKLETQTATDWWEAEGLTPFQAISGDGAFGADAEDEAQVIGSDDTSATDGAYFDLHEYLISAATATSAYVIRLVYGTGTMADAITAGQYSDTMFRVPANARQSPVIVQMPRAAVGTKVWVQAKNATNNATVDFFIGLHFYEG